MNYVSATYSSLNIAILKFQIRPSCYICCIHFKICLYLQKYISALTEESESSVHYEDANIVTAAVHFKEEIERAFATVLIISDDFKTVVIRGDAAGVNVTETLLCKIAQWANAGKDLAVFPFEDVAQQCNLDTNSKLVVQNAQAWGLDQVTNSYFDSSDIPSLQFGVNAINLTADHLNESSTDDEEIIQEIKSDPLYQSKVEFALKLGYEESDLVDALKTLGKEATQNELLSELIKNNAFKDEAGTSQTGDLSSRSQSSFEDDLVEEVTCKGQMSSGGGDPSPFRHIIMDGSNIAMR